MKAVIMAGGQGTRLKAVTGDRPKPLVPLLGKPLMEYILLLLRSHGFTQVCAAVRYRAQDITDCFGDGSRLGLELEYRLEDRALGTAGAVKNCADFCGDEDFLVISGDAACDFDLQSLMRRHRESHAAVTLALVRHPEPLRYGLAVTQEDGRIRAFVEKPCWGRVVTDLVNTGIYVVSPGVLDLIPPNTEFDFAKDLFPLLLQQNRLLLGVPMEGYWCDVGTPLSYYRCCVDALEGRLRLTLPEDFCPTIEAGEAPAPEGVVRLDCDCRSRAGLMGALSAYMLELNADYSDGIRLDGETYRMHIAPLPDASALRVCVQSPDTEFARGLAFSARDLIAALEA